MLVKHNLIATKLFDKKFSTAISIVKWISRVYLNVDKYNEHIELWFTKVHSRISSRGNLDTIKWIKTIHNTVLNYISGNPLQSVDYNIGLNSKGLPRDLGPLLELIYRGRKDEKRFLFTLLKVSRIISGQSLPNLRPIITERPYYPIKDSEVTHVIKALGIRLSSTEWKEPHLSTKSGPNGQALVSSIYELSILPSNLKENLKIIGGNKLISYMEQVQSSVNLELWIKRFDNLIKPKGLIRKFSLIHDPEAKCRIVGILDYWSQTALRPLHKACEKALKRIKTDCTFNQNHFLKVLPKSGPYYSLDLANATDSFKVDFLEQVLSILKSKEYASAWRKVMCDYEFYAPWDNQTYKYKQGQPMGAYSSWSLFALSHHIVVQIAAHRSGKTLPWTGYALLGDDIVLTDHIVVNHYKDIIHQLGGEFSKTKSLVSNNTYEFAKRIIHEGYEITGAPVRSFMVNSKYSFATETIIDNIESRWLLPNNSMITLDNMQSFMSIFHNNQHYTDYYANKAYDFWLLKEVTDPQLASEKFSILHKRMLNDLLGCSAKPLNSVKKLITIFMENARTAQESIAINKCYDNLNLFIEKNELINTLNEDARLTENPLSILPPYQVALRNLERISEELYEGMEPVSDEAGEIDLDFNPERSFQRRSKEIITVRFSKLVEIYLTKQIDLYKKLRDEAYIK